MILFNNFFVSFSSQISEKNLFQQQKKLNLLKFISHKYRIKFFSTFVE